MCTALFIFTCADVAWRRQRSSQLGRSGAHAGEGGRSLEKEEWEVKGGKPAGGLMEQG